MNTKEIEYLPEILKKNLRTFKKISYDDSHNTSMCDSDLPVISFDKFPPEYAKRHQCSQPKSNDGLYIDQSGWHFVEFKNGSIDKYDLFRKVYDSIIMLMDDGVIANFNFCRTRVTYTLVYNQNQAQNVKARNAALEKNNQYLANRAKREIKLYNVGELEGYLFRETHTYTPEEFEEKFVRPRETFGDRCLSDYDRSCGRDSGGTGRK
jgi:hypothetical protein